MKKKVLIGVLLIIELCSIYLMYKSSNNKEVLDNKEIKEEKKEKFAIMVQDDTGKYNKSSDTTFPSTGYVLNVDMSECLDIEGNKIENAISGSNGSVTLTNKYTSYCTLYFDLMSLGKFCDGQTNMGTCMSNKKSTIANVNNITSSEEGGMYRYQGIDNVNNWICFGTTNKTQCTSGGDTYGDGIDKYMYRIIGVTSDGQLALIKETGVKEGSTITFLWNDKYKPTEAECGTDGSKCIWPLSKLYNRLNGLCKSGNTNCTGSGTGSDGQSNIFIGNSYYEYLSNNTWLSKIIIHKWKFGDAKGISGKYDGNTIYAYENAFTSYVTAGIGIQYKHDYYYAYPGGNPGYYTTANTSWINFQKDGYHIGIGCEWLLSRYGVSSSFVGAYDVCMGSDGLNGSNLHVYILVRPVFYLTPSVKINNASGRKDDPFIITN